MEIGVIIFPPLGRAVQTAQMIEGLGFASMVFPDTGLSVLNLANEIVAKMRKA